MAAQKGLTPQMTAYNTHCMVKQWGGQEIPLPGPVFVTVELAEQWCEGVAAFALATEVRHGSAAWVDGATEGSRILETHHTNPVFTHGAIAGYESVLIYGLFEAESN